MRWFEARGDMFGFFGNRQQLFADRLGQRAQQGGDLFLQQTRYQPFEHFRVDGLGEFVGQGDGDAVFVLARAVGVAEG